MEYRPHGYQLEAKEFAAVRQAAALFLGCGLGKTVIVLDMLLDLFVSDQSKGVLIVAPLRVARLTWPIEIDKWDQFSWMKTVFIHGKDKLKKLNSSAEIYLINYEALPWLVGVIKQYPMVEWPFDTIIWDELTKMKSPGSVRFKAFSKIIHKFKKRIGLTATPTANGFADLYGQIAMLDCGERLGKTHKAFKNRFIQPALHWAMKGKLRPHADKQILDLIQDICLHMAAEEYLDTPKAETIDVELNLPASARKLYNILEEELFVEIDSAEVEALNAATLCGKCLQMAGGAVYHGEYKEWKTVHNIKLKAVEEIIKQHKGSPILLAYSFKHEMKRLQMKFPDAEVLKSGMSSAKEKKLQDDWNSGKIPLLICHPASAGHGLNLQYGGAIIIWFTINWSLELYHQFNKRIDRQGQTENPLVYRLIMGDTVDEVVATAVEQKDKEQRGFLTALKKYRENR